MDDQLNLFQEPQEPPAAKPGVRKACRNKVDPESPGGQGKSHSKPSPVTDATQACTARTQTLAPISPRAVSTAESRASTAGSLGGGSDADPLGPGLFDEFGPHSSGGMGGGQRPLSPATGADADTEPERSDGDLGRARDDAPAASAGLAPSPDFHLHPDPPEKAGPKSRARANLKAIEIFKRHQRQGTWASVDEQAALADYVGWGGIPQIFDETQSDWGDLRLTLKTLATPAEFAAMRRSTQDAHYTAGPIIRAIWTAVERLGFSGGTLLEPAFGIGAFWGHMPLALRELSRCVAVELDPTTAAIARQLYPSVQLQAGTSFQQFETGEGAFDLAIGNPPFGSQLIFDARNRALSGLSIHNYFFARAIDALRPGGLLAMVVSAYLLDAKGTRARDYLFERARLLGAIRLPNTAFLANAGTQVTTDIIFLQRRAPSEPADVLDWRAVGPVDDPNGGEPIDLNRYYHAYPKRILGQLHRAPSAFGPSPTVTPTGELGEQLLAAIQDLPSNLYTAAPRRASHAGPATPPLAFDCARAAQTKVFGFFYDPQSGAVFRRLPDQQGQLKVELRLRRQPGPADSDRQRMATMIELRDLVLNQIRIETDGTECEPTIERRRESLRDRYYLFRRYFGFLHEAGNKSLMSEDPQWPLLLALETHYDKGLSSEAAAARNVRSRPRTAELGMILRRRVRWPYRPPTHAATTRDALLISLGQRGRLDLDYMRSLTGFDAARLLADLGDEVFLDTNRSWVTRDEYLSGPVRAKLAAAQKRVDAGEQHFARNVAALQAVIPSDIPASDIHVRVGAPWLPAQVMSAFARHLFGRKSKADFHYLAPLGRWAMNVSPQDTVANTQRWGTKRRLGIELLEALINNQPIRIYDEDAKGNRTLNQEATQAAQDQASKIEEEFGKWLWTDADRRHQLVRRYNDLFNAHVERAYDGSHLTRNPDGSPRPLPGANPAIEFRTHQLNVIWRQIVERGGLIDHVVGAGKTYAICAILMELRRLGLVQRPMICVPNHLVGQWAGDFQTLYPGAKVLVPTPEDFQRERRQELLALIAAEDWDAVIVAHSSFGFIDMPLEEFEQFIQEQIDAIEEAIRALEGTSNLRRRSIKQMEKFKESLKSRLEAKLAARERDKVLDFSELGIDYLAVDESQQFKNLMFATALRNVAGLGSTSGSQRALDLFVKVRFLQRRFDGRHVLFATGTPISNSIAEMFTLQRYLAYEHLRELSLLHFDAWQTTFAKRTTDWEIDATATGYKLKERLASFCNLPELMTIYRLFADVVTKADIDQLRAASGLPPLAPPLHGDAPENIIAERSEAQALYMEQIVKRAERLRGSGDLKDNMLVITNDARKAALDMRLVDPTAADHPGSKVNLAIERIYRFWTDWEQKKGTQLVFCDLSTPRGARAHEAAILRAIQAQAATGDEAALEQLAEYTIDQIQSLAHDAFDVYNDIRAKLIARGVPRAEIAFIHDAHTDAQRQDLFAAMRTGRIRILLGSSPKMGAGTNVQTRLVALHHLDAPWKPMEVEQREGRILRQGNLFYEGDPIRNIPPEPGFEVHILRYSTRQTYDARMWQTIELKTRFIAQLRRGTSERAALDITAQAASAAEMKAAASGNPLIVEEVQLRTNIQRLENLRRAHQRRRYALEDFLRRLPTRQSETRQRITALQEDIRNRQAVPEGEFAGLILAGVHHSDRREAGQALLALMIQMQMSHQLEKPSCAQYRGFVIDLQLRELTLSPVLCLQARSGCYRSSYDRNDTLDALGITRRLDNLLARFEIEIDTCEQQLEQNEVVQRSAREEVHKPFDREGAYQELLSRHKAVLMSLNKADSTPSVA
jgi:N12 class adenine-specific DNA methylase